MAFCIKQYASTDSNDRTVELSIYRCSCDVYIQALLWTVLCSDFRSISIALPWQQRTAPSWSHWCPGVRKRRMTKGKSLVLMDVNIQSAGEGGSESSRYWVNGSAAPEVLKWFLSGNPSPPLSSFSLPSQRRLRDFISSRPPAFSYSVSILDLDPKPFESIPSQLRLDQKIVSCYLRTGGTLPKGSLPPLPDIFTAAERDDCTLLFHPMWTPNQSGGEPDPWRRELTPRWCLKLKEITSDQSWDLAASGRYQLCLLLLQEVTTNVKTTSRCFCYWF